VRPRPSRFRGYEPRMRGGPQPCSVNQTSLRPNASIEARAWADVPRVLETPQEKYEFTTCKGMLKERRKASMDLRLELALSSLSEERCERQTRSRSTERGHTLRDASPSPIATQGEAEREKRRQTQITGECKRDGGTAEKKRSTRSGGAVAVLLTSCPRPRTDRVRCGPDLGPP